VRATRWARVVAAVVSRFIRVASLQTCRLSPAQKVPHPMLNFRLEPTLRRLAGLLALTSACSNETTSPGASTGDPTASGSSGVAADTAGSSTLGGASVPDTMSGVNTNPGAAPATNSAPAANTNPDSAPTASAPSGVNDAAGGAPAADSGPEGTSATDDATDDETTAGGAAGAASGDAGDGAEATGGGAAADAEAPAQPTTTCPSGGWTAGDQTITLTHDGIEREYEVHVPPGYAGTTPVPLMLTIHGAHNTPSMVRNWSQMNTVADEKGFVVAYPAGIDCWNSGNALPGCTVADDDVGFLMSVVAEIQSHACIDPKRVYAAGISNGAMMAQRLACEKADVFAAVAGVAGPLAFSPCTPSRPISIVYVHGTEDTTVGYSSAGPTVNGWATRNDCTGSPVETYNVGSTVCETHQDCRDGVEVVFCTVDGMGHCWPEDSGCGPGGGSAFGVTDFKASPLIWEYFEQHPLP
jgi:polyhydroxybutyrate depolymerase